MRPESMWVGWLHALIVVSERNLAITIRSASIVIKMIAAGKRSKLRLANHGTPFFKNQIRFAVFEDLSG